MSLNGYFKIRRQLLSARLQEDAQCGVKVSTNKPTHFHNFFSGLHLRMVSLDLNDPTALTDTAY